MAFPVLRRRRSRPDPAPPAEAARPVRSAALYPVGGLVPGLALATSRALYPRA
ncbi:hypothetical protein [Blastococcus sp. SYSU DS0539]